MEKARVDIDMIQSETGLDIHGIAKLCGLRDFHNVYKWGYPKEKGGTRPTYDVIVALVEAGASSEALFGIPYSEKEKSIATSEEFKAGVKEALLDILNLKNGIGG